MKISVLFLILAGSMLNQNKANASPETKGILQVLMGTVGMCYGYTIMAKSYEKFKPEARAIWKALVAEAEVQYYANKCEQQATPRNLIPLAAATLKSQYYEKIRLPEAIKRGQQLLITTGIGAGVFASGVCMLSCGIKNIKYG